MIRTAAAALLFLLLGVAPAAAQGVAPVPSCYARVPAAHLRPAAPVRRLYVIVDQTTSLDPDLTRTLRQNVARLVQPGTAFTVASFSAFQAGHHASVVASGYVEPAVPAGVRNSVSVPALKQLDACLRAQAGYGVRAALAGLARAQATGGGSFSQSEIMASLKQLAAPIGTLAARDKVVILASDMLEHSSATSFYAHQGLRRIDPRAELAKAEANALLAEFGGARLYVIGAGVLPPQSKDAGRTIQNLNALQAFWTEWFRRSHARLGAFGLPDLVQPIP
ncbi:MAG: hypothetical protein E6G94_07915 [Alphaproteobacteria bacterium]|nr:MAG: hypothetical protein E6G94_07915 [Alphaproteobacteria bacterium]